MKTETEYRELIAQWEAEADHLRLQIPKHEAETLARIAGHLAACEGLEMVTAEAAGGTDALRLASVKKLGELTTPMMRSGIAEALNSARPSSSDDDGIMKVGGDFFRFGPLVRRGWPMTPEQARKYVAQTIALDVAAKAILWLKIDLLGQSVTVRGGWPDRPAGLCPTKEARQVRDRITALGRAIDHARGRLEEAARIRNGTATRYEQWQPQCYRRVHGGIEVNTGFVVLVVTPSDAGYAHAAESLALREKVA